MLTLIIVLAAVISALHLRTLMSSEDREHLLTKQEVNGAAWSIGKMWNSLMEQYGLPFAQYCVSVAYSTYLRLTFINVVGTDLNLYLLPYCRAFKKQNISFFLQTIFILKYVPTGFYMYRFIRDMYVTSRERIKQKQIEMEDIQLQVVSYEIFAFGNAATVTYDVIFTTDSDSEHEAVRAGRGIHGAGRTAAARCGAAEAGARARAGRDRRGRGAAPRARQRRQLGRRPRPARALRAAGGRSLFTHIPPTSRYIVYLHSTPLRLNALDCLGRR